jgi:hypothetical protein
MVMMFLQWIGTKERAVMMGDQGVGQLSLAVCLWLCCMNRDVLIIERRFYKHAD